MNEPKSNKSKCYSLRHGFANALFGGRGELRERNNEPIVNCPLSIASKPIPDRNKWCPITGMAVSSPAMFCEPVFLGGLQGFSFAVTRLQVLVKSNDGFGGGAIVHLPQRCQSASSPGLQGNSGNSQGIAIAPGCRFAGGEGE